jgi:hypothetical protein
MNDTGRSVALERNRDAVRVSLDEMARLVRECEHRCSQLEQALGASSARVAQLEASVAILRASTAGRGPTVRST